MRILLLEMPLNVCGGEEVPAKCPIAPSHHFIRGGLPCHFAIDE